MDLNRKIYVSGHKGLVGSAIVRSLVSKGYKRIVTRSHKDLDLTNQAQVQNFFQQEKPDYVILAAAKVGGIYANNTYPADFIYQNIMIEANVINSSYENQVKRLLFLGSTCIYPKSVEQPMREDALLTGPLESTNEPYALAKIAGIKICESYNRQHNTDFRSVMPTNLYGINDNFDLRYSHVVPAVMRKIHLAKCIEQNDWSAIRLDIEKNSVQGITKKSSNKEILNVFLQHGIGPILNTNTPTQSVSIWGTGNVKREFLFVDDMAEASLFVLGLDKEKYRANTTPMLSHINVGTGIDVTIREMAYMLKDIVGFKGNLVFDQTKPDGTPRKLIDVSRLSNMGWDYNRNLKEGLRITYQWYIKQNYK